MKGATRQHIPCPLPHDVSVRSFRKEDWVLLVQAMLHSRLDVITLCIPHLTLLLTRFSVAIVYILCVLFESVEMQLMGSETRLVCSSRRAFDSETVGCLDEFLKNLMDALAACRTCPTQDVLEPLPMLYFLDEEFYGAILDQNFIVLLRIFDSVKQYVT